MTYEIETEAGVEESAARGESTPEARAASPGFRRAEPGSCPPSGGGPQASGARQMRARGPGESAKLLLDVVDVLAACSIEYAVIGALAASLHGAGRASLDADLVVSASVMEGTRIDEALKRAGLTTELRRGDLGDAIPGLVRVSDSFGNQVDVLLGIRGLDPKAFSRTVEVPFEGARLRFVGREDFIAMKVAAGGPIDLLDAENAIAADPKSLDVELVRNLGLRFGTSTSASLERMLGDLGLGRQGSRDQGYGVDDDLE